MPYRRRYRRKRRYRRRGRTTRSMAKNALRVARAIMRRPEIKYFDTLFRANAVSWGGAELGVVNDPAQGITDITRVGDQIFCKSLWIRHAFSRLDSTNAQFIRVIYIHDYKNTVANITQLLDSDFSNEASIFANYIWDKRRDYKVLWDKIVNVSQDYRKSVYYTTKIKLRCKTQFQLSTTTIEQNAVKCFMITDVSPLEANKPIYSADCRLIYTDS